MIIQFGKYRDELVQTIVLKNPDYTRWIISQNNATGQMKVVQIEIMRLIAIFDKKALNTKCAGKNCNKAATKATVYLNNLAPHWWCDNCNPYQLGANSGKIQEIKTYLQALTHVDIYCNGNKTDKKNIIRRLAQAKGLPTRVGNKQAEEFFV